jgi:cystathionine beta-lyase/cystathionine gamma-synthase
METDLVLHSVTRYLARRSDVTAGDVADTPEDIARLRQIGTVFRAHWSPMENAG